MSKGKTGKSSDSAPRTEVCSAVYTKSALGRSIKPSPIKLTSPPRVIKTEDFSLPSRAVDPCHQVGSHSQKTLMVIKSPQI